MQNKIRLKSFYHLPREEIRQQSSSLKGASVASVPMSINFKLKIKPERYNFFKPILDYNREVSNNLKNAKITQEKTIQALQALASMTSLKGASYIHAVSPNFKVCKNGIFAFKNLSGD